LHVCIIALCIILCNSPFLVVDKENTRLVNYNRIFGFGELGESANF